MWKFIKKLKKLFNSLFTKKAVVTATISDVADTNVADSAFVVDADLEKTMNIHIEKLYVIFLSQEYRMTKAMFNFFPEKLKKKVELCIATGDASKLCDHLTYAAGLNAQQRHINSFLLMSLICPEMGDENFDYFDMVLSTADYFCEGKPRKVNFNLFLPIWKKLNS